MESLSGMFWKGWGRAVENYGLESNEKKGGHTQVSGQGARPTAGVECSRFFLASVRFRYER
jgi:hypothetical protein